MTGDKQILLLAQKNPADDDPGEDALYRVGTIATVLQLLKLPDGTGHFIAVGVRHVAVGQHDVDGVFLPPERLCFPDRAALCSGH